jgi:prevent-host-death family protein
MAVTETIPQIIVRNGKPSAIILDINKYEKLLEMAGDREDLLELRRIKKNKTSFRELRTYLKSRD